MHEALTTVLMESERILFFGGAGVSTESGIPDYRSGKGIYRTRKMFGRSPEEIIDHDFFQEFPDIFYMYYKENLIHRHAKPNGAHRALARLEREGKLSAVVTQNVDGLHQQAGSKNVFELHGSVARNHCVSCGATYDMDYVMDPLSCKEATPLCRRCGGVVRPDVVLFGEQLDQKTLEGAVQAIRQADTVIVGGTSLAVYPAAGLLEYYGGGRLVLINRDETPLDRRADLVIHDSIGAVLSQAVSALYPDFR